MHREQLQKLGLNEKEADVYLKLNTIGASPASTLAKLTNIKRTSIYDILNSLTEKGLIMAFRQGNYTYYGIDDINKLYYYQKEKLGLAQTIIKEMLEDRKNLTSLHLNYYRGEEGYRQLLSDVLTAKPSEIKVWVNMDNFYGPLKGESEIAKWTEERIKKKIPARILLTETSKRGYAHQSPDQEAYRETRYIPKEYSFNSTCFLFNNYILFFNNAEGEISGIRIQNAPLALMMNQIFEMNWQWGKLKTHK